MKRIITLASAVVICSAIAFAQPTAVKNDSKPANAANQNESIKWAKTSHDFGTVAMGPKAEVTFKFTNNSNAPVVIKSANASCGCTTPSYTTTPVMPGETGDVKASYGTEGRPGYFQKTVTVTFDNGVITTLTIQGTVATDTPAKKDNELK
ncbi:MAG: DUF1573 domain-containing protein [Bacteroidetes bacterium]|nr:DUF1573 domain-containing protein [Bacteroidota bacterium]